MFIVVIWLRRRFVCCKIKHHQFMVLRHVLYKDMGLHHIATNDDGKRKYDKHHINVDDNNNHTCNKYITAIVYIIYIHILTSFNHIHVYCVFIWFFWRCIVYICEITDNCCQLMPALCCVNHLFVFIYRANTSRQTLNYMRQNQRSVLQHIRSNIYGESYLSISFR